ncbi:mechanosensitive ion channel domain-containing protein [Hippea sp. KM1]|uniref:mechanosensitive ion channel domain-containing protein n=1 Tax=Hippea sp. KM1 TaxID=944481 RepID=UPI00046CCB61|nr:mechanosensitive ion channel domain-containing protein [Hippea sp. KM1]
MFKKGLGVVFFIAVLLPFNFICYGANIDQSLFKGNKSELLKRYQELLNNTPKTAEFLTQRTLLSALINIVSNTNSEEIQKLKPETTNIKNQYDFLKLLKSIARLELKYRELNKKLDQIDKKLELLKENISQSQDNDKGLVVYQLQYAMYELTKRKLEEKNRFLISNFDKWKELLYKSFLTVNFDIEPLNKEIKRLKSEYHRLENLLQQLNIKNDRFALTNDIENMQRIQKSIEDTVEMKDKIALKVFDDYLLVYLAGIKSGKTNLGKNLNKWMKRINSYQLLSLAEAENDLAFYIEKRKIGTLRMIIKQIKAEGFRIVVNVWEFVNRPLFSIGLSKVSILGLFLSLVIFILGIKIGRVYKIKVRNAQISKSMAESTKIVLSNVGYYIIVLLTFFIALRVIGINLSSFTVILGALSVGVGFGLQNIVSNFIAGIILMLENSIRVGDYIEISDDIKGVVEDIQIRSTTILTNDHIEVVVPNQTLFQSNVVNWTLTERVRRFKIPFSVAYGTDLDKVERVVLEALEKSDLNYVRDNPLKRPMVIMVAMNSSSVDFNLDVWVSGIDLIHPRRTVSKFLKLIYKTLYENDIVIPFPQMDIHIKEMPRT